MIKPGPSRPANNHLAARFLKRTEDLIFHHVHGGKLIYNACWEDPRIDRQLMQLNGESRVVMITSAGCNALDYLLDGPAEIHAVDLNFRQNALLELKLAMIQRDRFADLFEFFGLGSHTDFNRVYRTLRKELPETSRKYWDRKISYFDPRGLRKSFYYRGTAGLAAWLLGTALFKVKRNVKSLAVCLLDAESVEQQAEVFALLEEQLWDDLSNWLIRQQMIMTLLGVPRSQVKLIDDGYPGGLGAYIKDKLRHVMAELPAADNYFWRVYITGSYTMACCPNYLREANLATLQERAARLTTHTCSISQFLKKHPGKYTHFVLLDHQDWLAWHDRAALREEWELIFANSRPGAKVLIRSAALSLDFVPEDLRARLRFRPDLSDPLHLTDRVGTYGSLSFAEVI